MAHNIRSVVLFLLLFAFLTFLLGFRLGRKVEKVDKTYSPPTITQKPKSSITPGQIPTKSLVSFNTFVHQKCAVTFLYPDSLEEIEVSSSEARLVSKKQSIRVLCDPEVVKEIQTEIMKLDSSDEIQVGKKSFPTYQTSQNTKIAVLESGNQQEKILLEVPDDLAPLVFKTIEIVE